MRGRHILAFPTALLAGLVPALPARAAVPAACPRQMTFIDPIGRSMGGVADLNNRGQAVGGWGNADDESRPYFWDGRTTRDIGTLGGRYTDARTLTDSGYVMGNATTPESDAHGSSESHGFIWYRGVLTDLSDALPPEPPPAPPSSPGMPGPVSTFVHANAVNEHGVVVGYRTNYRESAGVLYDHGTLTTLIGPAGEYAVGTAINDAGQVAGYVAPGGSGSRAFVWRAGAFRDLGVFPGGDGTYPVDINEAGDVVGSGTTSVGGTHAFLWSRGHLTDLGTAGRPQSQAVAVNDRDQVIGVLDTDWDNERAFFWERGKMTDLGSLGGHNTVARSINNRGQVVGYTTTAANEGRAFLFEHGRMTDLGGLPGGTHSDASSINERGQIGGWAVDAAGTGHSVIWTPTC